MIGNQFPKFHSLAHRAAEWLGFSYSDETPNWVHLMMHIILVYGPSLLAVVTLIFIAGGLFHRGQIRIRQQRAKTRPNQANFNQSLFSNILRTTYSQQIFLLFLSLSLMPLLYLSLELPKQIVNNALEQSNDELTFWIFDVSPVQLLAVLSMVYLLTITLNGIGKYNLNVRKGKMAERFLRRLRLRIYRDWRSHSGVKRKSEVSQVLSQEVEPEVPLDL